MSRTNRLLELLQKQSLFPEGGKVWVYEMLMYLIATLDLSIAC